MATKKFGQQKRYGNVESSVPPRYCRSDFVNNKLLIFLILEEGNFLKRLRTLITFLFCFNFLTNIRNILHAFFPSVSTKYVPTYYL